MTRGLPREHPDGSALALLSASGRIAGISGARTLRSEGIVGAAHGVATRSAAGLDEEWWPDFGLLWRIQSFSGLSPKTIHKTRRQPWALVGDQRKPFYEKEQLPTDSPGRAKKINPFRPATILTPDE